jgi:hypothetical protein
MYVATKAERYYKLTVLLVLLPSVMFYYTLPVIVIYQS